MQLPMRDYLNYLVEKNILSQQDALKYEVDALKTNTPIDTYLLDRSLITIEQALQAKAAIFQVPWVDISTTPASPQALNFIPESIARNYVLVPFDYDEKNGVLKIAMANPLNLEAIDFLRKKSGKTVVAHLALDKDIQNVIDTAYTQGLSPDINQALDEVKKEAPVVPLQAVGQAVKEAPIAKIVTTILEYAVKGRASDVHIEPQELKTRVRYRIDGILQEKLVLPKGIHEALVSRIKILSGMKIDEKRVPQDGRFTFKIGQEEDDLRISTLPTVHGEKVVMRLLKKTGGIPSLNDLGLRGPQLKALEEAVTKPYGIVLVTGPTGSGKSTTLNSLLSKLNSPRVNIVTLEDPVEYQIPGVNQVQINPQAGLTFATGLRSFLRQDPNIILVGEIRDKETTTLALQAALTGHLVFSTLHTNDAATAIPRLLDLEAEAFLIASVLNAAVGQRIARKLCDACKEPFQAPPEIAEAIKKVLQNLLPAKYLQGQPMTIHKNKGCQKCGDTGYYGRVGIFEVLTVSPAIRKLVIQEATAKDIETQARTEGLITMKEDGFLKVLEGVTTIEEVLRVAEV